MAHSLNNSACVHVKPTEQQHTNWSKDQTFLNTTHLIATLRRIDWQREHLSHCLPLCLSLSLPLYLSLSLFITVSIMAAGRRSVCISPLRLYQLTLLHTL